MENPLLLRMSQQRGEWDQGYRKIEQEGVRRRSCCAWTTKHKLYYTHVSLMLPFEEPMTCAGNALDTFLATVRVPFADTQHTTVKSQRSASKLLEECARVNKRGSYCPVNFPWSLTCVQALRCWFVQSQQTRKLGHEHPHPHGPTGIICCQSIKNEPDKNTDHWRTQRQNISTDFSCKNVR